MIAMVNFDTLNFMEELEKSGMDQKQAEAITKATAMAFAQMMQTQELITKKDLRETENILKKDIRETEISLKKDINELEMKMYRFIIKATMTTVGLLGALNTFFHYFPK